MKQFRKMRNKNGEISCAMSFSLNFNDVNFSGCDLKTCAIKCLEKLNKLSSKFGWEWVICGAEKEMIIKSNGFVDRLFHTNITLFLVNNLRRFMKTIDVKISPDKTQYHIKLRKKYRNIFLQHNLYYDDGQISCECARCSRIWDGLAQCTCTMSQPSLSFDSQSLEY